MAMRFPTKEHLRKTALIHTGYADRQDVVCATPEDALRLAAIARTLDQYCIVRVRDCVVAVWRARSQDHRSMDSKTFQDSKDKVLTWAANLIGVQPAAVTETRQIEAPRERQPGEDED
jgi:hypothetical protein